MKVVLLAAGRSFRMAPIADKTFLEFVGKPLIVHQLEALVRASCKEILVVGGAHNVGKLRGVLRDQRFKNSFARVKIAVREQKDLEQGMAGGVLTATSWIKNEPFLLMSSNDVLDSSVFSLLRAKMKKDEGVMLAYKVKNYFPGGYLKVSASGIISKIIEKPGAGKEPSKLVNIVMHYHPQPKLLFKALKKIVTQDGSAHSGADDAYEKAVQQLFDQKIIYRPLPFSGFWQPIKYPWHVLSLTSYFLSKLAEIYPKGRVGGRPIEVAKTAVISGGDSYFEDGVRILDHAIVQGPVYVGKNTIIGSHAFVRQSQIGANSVIGFSTEVARSTVGNNVWTHSNYIGDSIIGNDVSFGSGTVTGNLRLDEKSIEVNVEKTWGGKISQERIDSGLNKIGIITGDHVRVGINTSFMPGVKIGSNAFVGAGIVVPEDVAEGSFVSGEWKLKVRPNHAKITPRA